MLIFGGKNLRQRLGAEFGYCVGAPERFADPANATAGKYHTGIVGLSQCRKQSLGQCERGRQVDMQDSLPFRRVILFDEGGREPRNSRWSGPPR